MSKLLSFKFPEGWFFLNCYNTEFKRSPIFFFVRRASLGGSGLRIFFLIHELIFVKRCNLQNWRGKRSLKMEPKLTGCYEQKGILTRNKRFLLYIWAFIMNLTLSLAPTGPSNQDSFTKIVLLLVTINNSEHISPLEPYVSSEKMIQW